MGVSKLWELLAPAGKQVSPEALAGKIVAVDVSIWLIGLLAVNSAEDRGASQKNAHLRGLFVRCCKMLCFGMKPVIVFDGATPAIKLHELERRRKANIVREQRDITKRASRILKKKIAEHSLRHQIIPPKLAAPAPAPVSAEAMVPDKSVVHSDTIDVDLDEQQVGQEASLGQAEVDLNVLEELPHDLQLEVLRDLLWTKKQQGNHDLRSTHTSVQEFSMQQVTNLLGISELSSKVQALVKAQRNDVQPVASEPGVTYLLQRADSTPTDTFGFLEDPDISEESTSRKRSSDHEDANGACASESTDQPEPSASKRRKISEDSHDEVIQIQFDPTQLQTENLFGPELFCKRKGHCSPDIASAGNFSEQILGDEYDRDLQLAIALSAKEHGANTTPNSEVINVEDDSIGDISPATEKSVKLSEGYEHQAAQVVTAIEHSPLRRGDPPTHAAPTSPDFLESSEKPTADFNKDGIKVCSQIKPAMQREKISPPAPQPIRNTLTLEMTEECEELLRLFGIPFVRAPMEAEAQCAYLNSRKLVDAVISEDSDTFLFGATAVFRHLFSASHLTERFLMPVIEDQLGFDRETLINLALLLGSDYTPGVTGIGVARALEVLAEFPNLLAFKEWLIDKADDSEELSTELRKLKHKAQLEADFPSSSVINAYLHPNVDVSLEQFSWGQPNFEMLEEYALKHLGWPKETTERHLKAIKTSKFFTTSSETGKRQTRLEEFSFVEKPIPSELTTKPAVMRLLNKLKDKTKSAKEKNHLA